MTDIRALEDDPRLYLYTSLTAGSSHVITATSRIQVILTANKYPFVAVDLATNEPAKRIFQRRGGKRKLPVLAKEGFVLGDLDEIEEWNEFGELADHLGPPVPLDQITMSTADAEADADVEGAAEPVSTEGKSGTKVDKSDDGPIKQFASLAAEAAATVKSTAAQVADKITETLPSNDYVAAKKSTEEGTRPTTVEASSGHSSTESPATAVAPGDETLPLRQSRAESKEDNVTGPSVTDTSGTTLSALGRRPETSSQGAEIIESAEQEMARSAATATSSSAPVAAPKLEQTDTVVESSKSRTTSQVNVAAEETAASLESEGVVERTGKTTVTPVVDRPIEAKLEPEQTRAATAASKGVPEPANEDTGRVTADTKQAIGDTPNTTTDAAEVCRSTPAPAIADTAILPTSSADGPAHTPPSVAEPTNPAVGEDLPSETTRNASGDAAEATQAQPAADGSLASESVED